MLLTSCIVTFELYALFSHDLIRLGTLFLFLPSLSWKIIGNARVLPLVFKLIFVRIKPHLSSLPSFLFSLPSLLFSLPRGIGFNSKCGGCKSNGKWRDDNDGWMDGWMEPRVWRSSYKNRSGKKKWNEMFSRGFGFPSDQCGNVCLFNEESIALLFHHPWFGGVNNDKSN